MAQRPIQNGIVNGQQQTHHPVPVFGMERAAHKQGAQHGHHRDRQQRGSDHRKCFCEGERMKQFPFLSREREHRHESEDDDRHRKENGAAHLFRSRADRLPSFRRIQSAAFGALGGFAMTDDIFRYHNSCIHQHADGDGDAGKRHDVGSDVELLHQDK
ncbi:MAG: hypothetical protein JW388_0440 [Nitrospira sp.]|nr:hypothetical protein [Nitrospira sp.]